VTQTVANQFIEILAATDVQQVCGIVGDKPQWADRLASPSGQDWVDARPAPEGIKLLRLVSAYAPAARSGPLAFGVSVRRMR
jgi:hypothetical protein